MLCNYNDANDIDQCRQYARIYKRIRKAICVRPVVDNISPILLICNRCIQRQIPWCSLCPQQMALSRVRLVFVVGGKVYQMLQFSRRRDLCYLSSSHY